MRQENVILFLNDSEAPGFEVSLDLFVWCSDRYNNIANRKRLNFIGYSIIFRHVIPPKFHRDTSWYG
ncbi:MAG: hypothetical protein JWR10_3003 [Rubritepida sp.]|nr:hypothetical protein [Rubritepida sp.]